jgi:phage terminase large subunit GpA-like protein
VIPTRTAAAVVAASMLAWQPPPRLRLSEWADRHFYLSAESAAEPGRWKTYAYQREPMDAMTDPTIREVVFIKSARVGYTKMLNAAIAYHMHHDPCAILLIQPTEDDAKGYSKEEIEPMLRDCAALADVVPEALKRRNTMQHIRFRGGLLQLASARSPGDFRRTSRRVVFGDEVDGYQASSGEEGDPISLAKKRSEYFWNRKWAWGSTPANIGSRIERLFLEGDQRRYYVPCPHCGHSDFLAFSRETDENGPKSPGHVMSWPKGRPEEACFVCSGCGSEIEHEHKRSIIDAGEWRASAPFTGTASFWIWSAYSCSPNTSWAEIATEYEKAAAAGVDQLKVFVNTWLGQVWRDTGEAPDWEFLYARRDDYAIGTCPDGVLFLTAGVDVQRDRIVWEVVGWGRGKRSWSIDAGIIAGKTADQTAEGPWPQLEALLNRTFRHASGVELRIRMMAVDAGDQAAIVYDWTNRHVGRTMAVKGSGDVDVLVGTPKKQYVSYGGRRVGGKLWRVSGHIAKSELYGALRLKAPTDEARAAGAQDPPLFCRFPQYGEEFFKQLTGEQLAALRNQHGFTVHTWTLIQGRENHWLDARCYARAAAAVVNLDRLADVDWRELERAIGQTPRPTDDTHTPTPTPPATRAPQQARQPGWISRRPGWINRKG